MVNLTKQYTLDVQVIATGDWHTKVANGARQLEQWVAVLDRSAQYTLWAVGSRPAR